MVFRKQRNDEGNYIDIQGNRYDILSCNVTESKQWREVGRENTEVEPGVFVEEPIMEEYVAINYGWDEYSSLEQAIQAYGLIYKPIEGKK